MAHAAESDESRPPPDLPVVTLPAEPVPALLARIAAEGGDEADALRAFDALVALGGDAVEPLAWAFTAEAAPDEQRWVAARALGRIGGPRATALMRAGLGSPRVMDRLAAANALGDLASPEAAPELASALSDPALAVRIAAANALAALGPSAPADALLRALASNTGPPGSLAEAVRAHVARALGNTSDRRAVRPLVATLDDGDPRVRSAAVLALSRLVGSGGPAPAPSEVPEARAAAWKRWWEETGAATYP